MLGCAKRTTKRRTPLRPILSPLLCSSIIFLCTSVAIPQDRTQDRVVSQAVLDIDPVEQQTLEWCWLSVGEMIFTYLDLDEPPTGYQCGTMAMITGKLSLCWLNCKLCPYAAGTMPNLEKMIKDYPQAIAAYKRESIPLRLTLSSTNGVLDWDRVKTQILNKSPIVAAVNPFNPHRHVPQHVALIVGFKEEKGKNFLLVNDPAPYGVVGIDPYGDNDADEVQDFQYWIEYDKFKDGLAWNYSAYDIHDPSHHKSVSELGISLKYAKAATSATPTPAGPSKVAEHLGDVPTYLPLDQALSVWIQESSNNFANHKVVYPIATYATPGFEYLGEKYQCDITDSKSHQCIFGLYGGSDSAAALSTYSNLDTLLGSTFPHWSRSEPSTLEVAGSVKVSRKFSRTKDNITISVQEEVFSPQKEGDASYYIIDLTFAWVPN